MDWKKVKCNKCPEFKKCKKTNTSKGSTNCQILLKLTLPKEEKKGISKEAATSAMLWAIVRQNQKEIKNENEL